MHLVDYALIVVYLGALLTLGFIGRLKKDSSASPLIVGGRGDFRGGRIQLSVRPVELAGVRGAVLSGGVSVCDVFGRTGPQVGSADDTGSIGPSV